MTPFCFTESRRACLAAIFALAATSPALAWSDKPVKLLVPAPAGGTMDVVARVIADQLSTDLGQPVVVDNKPGAGGAIAVQALRAAPPNGQTLMVTASNVLTEIPHVMKTGFDPLKDIKPVGVIARSTMVLIGAPDVPARDVKGLIRYLKAQPGQHSFASYSAGTASHYAGVIFNRKAGLDLQHVPFAGSPPALTQVMAGRIPIMFDGMATARPMISGDKVRAFGVASPARSPQLPNVPTLAEQGLPELNFSNWIGVVAGGNMAPELVEKIHTAVARAAAASRVKARLQAAGFDAIDDLTPSQLAQSMRAEFQRNADIVQAFEIKLNP